MVVKMRAQQYLEDHVLTAPREELLLMLFDGAIRFAEQAKLKIEAKDIEGSCALLIKAQRIVIELMTSLKRDVIGDELYSNLTSLYNFVYFRLVNANVRKDRGLVDEALKIMTHLRGTWALAVEKNRKETHPERTLLEEAQRAQDAAANASSAGSVNLEG